MWVVRERSQAEIVAQGNYVIYLTEENKHLAQFDISILPENRRQGLGRQLLQLIAGAAQKDHRRLLMTSTVDRIPAGMAFMTRIQAKKGLEAHTNQLKISDLRTDLVEDWLAKSQKNLAEFELGFWDGAYPEEELEAISDLIDLTNQQPLGELDIEDMHMTSEQLRQMENNIFARGNQRWTYFIRNRVTGKFAGYTETIWNPNRPEILRQDMTGVFPEYRNKGLGRWLKAAMLEKVINDRPQVKYIRTGNADSNAAMLRINTQMGFKPYMADTLWQVDLQQVLDYLQTPRT